MKLKKLKALSLALLLPLLAGCDFIDNIVGKIVLDFAFKTDFIVNKIDVKNQSKATISDLPTSEAKRLSLTYGLDLLAFPKDVKIEEFKDYPISFTYKFSDNTRDLFFEAVETPEAMEEASASLTAFYPLGTLDKPEAGTELSGLKDFLKDSPEKFISLTEEPDVNFTVEVTGKVKKTTHTEKYFFKLTSDGLPKLEVTEEDLNVDYLLAFRSGTETKTKTFTLTKAELNSGVNIPFQVGWLNIDDLTDTRSGNVVITVTTDLTGYDVTEDTPNSYSVVVNQTLVTHNLHVKNVAATASLDITFSVKLTVDN